MTSPTATAEIERLAREAPATWRVHPAYPVTLVDAEGYVVAEAYYGQKFDYAVAKATAAYIAAVSPDVVLGLLAALRAAEAERDGLREALEPFAAADRAMCALSDPIRVETLEGYREMKRDDFRRARAALQSTAAPQRQERTND